MGSATIVDVARAAGVSKTTASDALRGHGRVSEATRVAVAEAAASLGYTINRSARSLRTATTGAIGLYVPQVIFRSEYYLSFVYGVANEAAKAEYDVTLIMSGQLPSHGHLPNVDGIVLCDPVASDPVVRGLMATGLAVVTCERYNGDRVPNGVIWSDHAAYLEQLLDELAGADARHPAMLASTTVSDWSISLVQKYRSWCLARGIEPVIREVPFGTDPAALQDTTLQFLQENPTVDALVCAADGVAAAAIPAIRLHGRTIGEDFLLASCVDGTSMRIADPAITAIDTKGGEAGSECARLLFELLDGSTPEGTVREMPLELNQRASTGA
ncbi:LacI family DNA-binding transcriptional regulator [Herbiconiux sp.]|uniref:LacI family DNA-binding transcriptional regulator n=1 Tax=Herbiconiux sp. TaxID=1871186 RepID=UPI0025C248A4|nr:LacI family DNA-binding transcriptional regulator [Herbiconiux sp.]